MKKALLIINPTSGGEKALTYKGKLERKAGQYFDHVETKITELFSKAMIMAWLYTS